MRHFARLQIVILAATALLTSACADLGTAKRGSNFRNAVEVVPENASPDPHMAYLIIAANAIPADRPQPVRISITRHYNETTIDLTNPIVAIRDRRLAFLNMDLADENGRIVDRDVLYGLPTLKLEPGKIYYYGRIEMDYVGPKPRWRIVRDPELFRDACLHAQQVFLAFDVVDVNARYSGDEPLPQCDVLRFGQDEL